MGDYEQEMEKYANDSRIACRYGRKCYQKNPDHHKKYKHPPKRRPSNDTDADKNTKKQKVDDTVDESKQKGTNGAKNNDLRNFFKPTLKANVTPVQTIEDEKKQPSQHEQINETTASTSDDTSEIENAADSKREIQIQTSTDKKQFIKDKFLVEMPDDFYRFYDFCKTLNPQNPLQAFSNFDLLLVGPYDVLADKFVSAKEKSAEEYLIHWRYYYDPPEFQTVLKGDDKRGYHIGYFRDSPDEKPVFLAKNCAEIDGVIEAMGNNIFAAVHLYLDEYSKTGDPFKKAKLPKIQAALKEEAEKFNLSLVARPASVSSRDKKIVTRTFNRAGLVVPYNRRTQLGYRGLALSNKELHVLLKKLKTCAQEQQMKLLSDLQPVITYASIALDECDFGTGVELGWNLLFYGIDSVNATTLRFLRDSYNLLNRDAFAKIAEAHLSNRRKGCNLSIL